PALFFLMRRRPPRSPRFPYTTLFRSEAAAVGRPPVGRRRPRLLLAPPPPRPPAPRRNRRRHQRLGRWRQRPPPGPRATGGLAVRDRKSTRLNSSHSQISYAVFCLKKK